MWGQNHPLLKSLWNSQSCGFRILKRFDFANRIWQALSGVSKKEPQAPEGGYCAWG